MNVDKLCQLASRYEHVRLLRIPEVVRWLHGDVSFIRDKIDMAGIAHKKKNEILKDAEDRWGRQVMQAKNLDKGQWTGPFGERVAQELLILQGLTPMKPIKKLRYKPDWSVTDRIVEVKTGTFFTTGTAHEKILGAPYKYADVPELYCKPLVIWCLGAAERYVREQCDTPSPRQRHLLDKYKEMGITFSYATDIICTIIEAASFPKIRVDIRKKGGGEHEAKEREGEREGEGERLR